MKSRELKEKIISKKTANLLKNYVLTIINNKNEINQNLKPEDLNIIISSGNGRKKKIFSSLSLVNIVFDQKTYSKNNIEKFKELTGLIEPLDEEGINPFEQFEELEFSFVPKLEVGLKFNLNNFDFKTYKENEEIKTFDKSILNNNEGKYLFCIYSTKLSEKPHKLKKIIDLIEKILDDKKNFFTIFKKILIIFEVKSLEDIEKQVLRLLPIELRGINDEKENFVDFEVLFNIKKENDDNSPSDIFTNNDLGRTFFFILNSENYITKIKTLYRPDIITEIINEKLNLDNNQSLDKKIEAFYDYYEFLKNIKEAKYYFYLNYHFNLVLTYSEIEDKLFIKDVDFTRFNGEFRPKEYQKLKQILSITKPENLELREIESIDIEIDFDNMLCIKCSKEINNDEELFYCFICKHKYCVNCVKKHLQDNIGKNKFIDPQHNLIFFKTRNKNDFHGIDKYKLGNNTFTNTDEKELGKFRNILCNGCALQFATSVRYICLSCNPGMKHSDGFTDYCQNCVDHMSKNDQKGEEIQKRRYNVYYNDFFLLREEKLYMNHNHNSHVYLMVPLASLDKDNPYYDY